MSVISEASSAQSSGGYAVDLWLEAKLEPMTKVWQGVGGHSNFFFSEEDARDAKGAYEGSQPYRFAETLWRMAQVQPSSRHGFRQEIAEFVVDLPVSVAMGICHANTSLGSGSVFQYYIPEWDKFLFRTGRRFTFAAKGY